MQKELTLKLLPAEAASSNAIHEIAAAALATKASAITGFHRLRQSIDARGRQVFINLTIHAFINEPFVPRSLKSIDYQPVKAAAKKVIIVGAGPAGLFAALRLIENGIQPVILERGKDVRSRRRDLAVLNKQGIINPESNYCFGEGGAGTYSDGKLYTRSNKRGDIGRILNLFVQFGADEKILYKAHPHIGTNKLPQIITQMRQAIQENGGLFLFEQKVVELVIAHNDVKGVITASGAVYDADAVVLATGHSARDVFTMLHKQGVAIEAKPFALGVRIEHPQSIIDAIQYGANLAGTQNEGLPPASYNLVQQVNEKGVFSFCMCPGGIIAPAATSPGELVVNGWSPSKRNNLFANSGMVVSCSTEDLASVPGFKEYLRQHDADLQSPLALLYFQQLVEQACYAAGGGNFVAPAQRMVDFCRNQVSSSMPGCSYLPGIHSTNLGECLPAFIHTRLQQGFRAFGQKMNGYYTNEALVVATESRTSSPVRIPRDNVTLQHPQLPGLYPCGEGAGYAGGIVSAAMDGERVAGILAEKLK